MELLQLYQSLELPSPVIEKLTAYHENRVHEPDEEIKAMILNRNTWDEGVRKLHAEKNETISHAGEKNRMGKRLFTALKFFHLHDVSPDGGSRRLLYDESSGLRIEPMPLFFHICQ